MVFGTRSSGSLWVDGFMLLAGMVMSHIWAVLWKDTRNVG